MCVLRTMLQKDPRRRPRVEDLENLPALQPAMNVIRNQINEYKVQQSLATKNRELKSKEDTLAAREEAVTRMEASLKEREERLMTMERNFKLEQEKFEMKVRQFRRQQANAQQGQGTGYPDNEEMTIEPTSSTGSDGSTGVPSTSSSDRGTYQIQQPVPPLPQHPQRVHKTITSTSTTTTTSTTSTTADFLRRGPVPMPGAIGGAAAIGNRTHHVPPPPPTGNANAVGPSFQIHCDFPLDGPTQPTTTVMPVPPSAPTGMMKRPLSAQNVNIAGTDNKENAGPSSKPYKFAPTTGTTGAAGIRRPMAAVTANFTNQANRGEDCFASPLKKMRPNTAAPVNYGNNENAQQVDIDALVRPMRMNR